MNKTDWRAIGMAALHDPPQKALKIQRHEARAASLASTMLGEQVASQQLQGGTRSEDILSSMIERVPMPTAGADGERAVGPVDGRLAVSHPLSAASEQLQVEGLDRESPQQVLEAILDGVAGERERVLVVWRLLRDELSQRDPVWAALPADSRQPDHTIWHHLDLAAGASEGLADAGGLTLLSFSLGPVQPFIAAARTVRDLWSGSFLLSWLTFHAMLPVVEACGPAAFVYPMLRGVPLMDRWLRQQPGLERHVPRPSEQALLTPCLPNRFLALVPWGSDGERARELAGRCEAAAREAWHEICRAVREELDSVLSAFSSDWDRLWEPQVTSFFEVRTSLMRRRDFDEASLARLVAGQSSFAEAFPEAVAVRSLAELIPEGERYGFSQKHAGRWGAELELSARLMAARRTVRHFPEPAPDGEMVPLKCSLLGTFEQMGPAELEASREFWGDLAQKGFNLNGTRLGSSERLCALSLVKRFAWPAFLARKLGLNPQARRFPDTATVAARQWLGEVDIDPDAVWRRRKYWSGQWLHWPSRDHDPDEDAAPPDVWQEIEHARQSADHPPPTYLAVLVMDGDRLGRWLRGELAPTVREALHPKLRAYWEAIDEAETALEARRPVGGALHAAISEALSNFALHVVPRIVADHQGELIYAGGDDVLALLPVSRAVACALALRQAYRREWVELDGRRWLLMGRRATVSAGLAVVHHKEDLRYALEQGRSAEAAAKESGRDALAIAACRRSGEHSRVLMPWSFCEELGAWVERFRRGATDRWAYRARQELPTLRGLPLSAQRSELLRLVRKTDDQEAKARFDPDEVGTTFDRYSQLMTDRGLGGAGALEGFIVALQTASFLARGRDL